MAPADLSSFLPPRRASRLAAVAVRGRPAVRQAKPDGSAGRRTIASILTESLLYLKGDTTAMNFLGWSLGPGRGSRRGRPVAAWVERLERRSLLTLQVSPITAV